MNATDPTYEERLAAEAGRVRDSGDLGRSESLVRLFDYLLTQSLTGRAPGEIEIAQEVFNKTTDFEVMLDASVRVHIHRLRRKIAEHYAKSGSSLDRLSIPLGQYLMVLKSTDEPKIAGGPDTVASGWWTLTPRRFWLALGVLAAINVLAWMAFAMRPPVSDGPVLNNLWRPIFEGRRPTTIVTGDYYMFGESTDGFNVTRLVRDFSINSRKQLDAHLLLNPDRVGRYVDLDLHYLPQSIAPALHSLLPTINAAAGTSGRRPIVFPMSELKPDLFKLSNVVYVGYFSGLGALQDPVFKASGFHIGQDYDELVDKTSGRHFRSDWGLVEDGKPQHRDYGYIASLIGPDGNRIVIIAGTRDPAVVQMAEIATDPKQLDAIDAKSGDGAFEAFYEVRTLGNLNLSSSLILVRPLNNDSIWKN